MTKPRKPSGIELELVRQLADAAPGRVPASWAAAMAPPEPPEPPGDGPGRFVNSDDARAWLDFDRANPAFYPMFCRFAREALYHGHTRLSAWLIVNRIRWETNIVARRDDGYKIGNGLIAFYARMWSLEHPRYPHFFQQKAMKLEPPSELFAARAAERQKKENP